MRFLVMGLAALLSGTSAQQDGNPHNWDRLRRCDWDYDPPCKPCEGIGGIPHGDENHKIDLTTCLPVEQPHINDVVKPTWGTKFTLQGGYHEVLIGKKSDPLCAEVFPGPDSVGELCYRRQEGTLYYDMTKDSPKAISLDLNLKLFNIGKNVTGQLVHQGLYMWIVNELYFNQDMCLCFIAVPDLFMDIRPHLGPVQYNWVDKADYVGREKIGLEFLWESQVLDHWVLGPHNFWTNITTGKLVRMWQPFNGLEVFDYATYSEEIDPSVWEIPPPKCKKGGAQFRINCDDDGFSLPCSNETYTNKYCHYIPPSASPTANPDTAPPQQSGLSDIMSAFESYPTETDLARANNPFPSMEFKGSSVPHTAEVLNNALDAKFDTRACEDWSIEELQSFQKVILAIKHDAFDGIYKPKSDNRRMTHDSLEEKKAEFEEHNAITDKHDRMVDMQKAGLCAESVMWFIHHLTDTVKDLVVSGMHVPNLSEEGHECPEDANEHEEKICKAYTKQISCTTCHSLVYPDED